MNRKTVLKIVATVFLVPILLGLMLMGIRFSKPGIPLFPNAFYSVTSGVLFVCGLIIVPVWIWMGIGKWTLNTVSAPQDTIESLSERVYRLENALCVSCGYNIRDLPGPRCPECGAEIPYLSHKEGRA